ncbi:MAG: hydantoinase/oxoprolinase N-terminal domain-containing protein [Eggerthellaceae bacterium]
MGGTNTDAVVIDGDLKLVAATKAPPPRRHERHRGRHARGDHPDRCRRGAQHRVAMLGTTHCTNAIVERKRLNKVAAARGRSGHDGHQLHG